MGDKLDILKSFPGCIEATFEEVGLYKALRAKIVFTTLREKLFLAYMVTTSMILTGYVAIKLIRWVL